MASANTHTPSISSASSGSKVNLERIQRAVNALLKWKETQSKSQKPQLLPQDDFMYLILTLKKIPPKDSGRTNPYKILLPHPLLLHDSFSELCLIIDDRPNSKLTSDIAKKKIKSEEIPVAKVLKLSKLKTDYKPFEAKRQLCDSYDMFFADKRVLPLLPKLLGKQFFKKKKLPLPVDLTHKNWKEQIERACSSALLYLKTGTCSVVRAGKMSMEREEIAENVAAAIDGVVQFVPKKWAGVRSLHLKFSESLALPVYQALPDVKLKIEGIKEIVEGVKEEGRGMIMAIQESKTDEKLGKKKVPKKGRIHEVRYMDANVGEDEFGSDIDYSEGEKSENDNLGNTEFVGKRRKNGDAGKGLVLGKFNGEKPAKKKGKVKKGVSNDVNDKNETKKSVNDDLGSAGKKKRKGDMMKGEGLGKKDAEKIVKKISKKGAREEQRKGRLVLKHIEDSDGKKGKRKSDIKKTVKNAAISLKVKKSEKQSAA